VAVQSKHAGLSITKSKHQHPKYAQPRSTPCPTKNTTKLSRKFQITIPKPNGVLLVAVPSIDDLGGSVPNANTENYRDRKDRY
jgi:hypothetical protein